MPSPLEWLLAPVTLGGSLAAGAARESDESAKARAQKSRYQQFEKSLSKGTPFKSFATGGAVSAPSEMGRVAKMPGQGGVAVTPSEQGRSPGITPFSSLASQVTLGSGVNQPSDWANMMLQRQQLEQTGAVDAAQAGARSEALGAWNQLAMRGGASGGERERLARFGARGLNEARQRIGREGEMSRFGILGDDQSRQLDIQKFNIGTLISERDKAEEAARRERERQDQIKAAAYGADIQGGKY